MGLCSDGILAQLIKANPKYKQFLIDDRNSSKQHKNIMLNNLGSLTINDFLTMAQRTNNLFTIIPLPLKPTTEKSRNNPYNPRISKISQRTDSHSKTIINLPHPLYIQH